MDRKPILVIYLESPYLRQSVLPQLEKVYDEYHVLVLTGKENKCEFFSGEKIDPIEIEDLKNSLFNHDNSVISEIPQIKRSTPPKPIEEKGTTSIRTPG